MWGISKEYYGIQKNKLKQCRTNREQNSLENRLYSPFQKQQKCFSKIPLSSLIKKKKKVHCLREDILEMCYCIFAVAACSLPQSQFWKRVGYKERTK